MAAQEIPIDAGSTVLLDVRAIRRADEVAISSGTSGAVLMERAGAAIAARAVRRVGTAGSVLVLCGPGNNGGDGFVAARLLAAAGRDATLALLGQREALRGDAAEAAKAWRGPILDAAAMDGRGFDLVIDALYGAGLSRPVDGDARALIERVTAAGTPVLAVDMPSGIDGDTGAVRGCAMRAVETVTFVRRKPGHLLLPGRAHCGEVVVADIGIGQDIVDGLASTIHANEPALWNADFPRPGEEGHKYARGHALVVSGPATRTGAARLSARAALRVGAGLVTVAARRQAVAEHAAHLDAIMLRPCDDAAELSGLLEDARYSALVAGPGLGGDEVAHGLVRAAIGAGRSLVLDADALTLFAGRARDLAEAIGSCATRTVLTPHSGEFARLFDGEPSVLDPASKVERARRAAALAGAVVVLKGADTVIADPGGRAAINAHATPYLGTAGTGDVLAGLIAGLLAQGMAPFTAACAAVWLHGDAGRRVGPGLVAEDLPERMPEVLSALLADRIR